MTKKMRFSMIMAITALLCIIVAVFVSPERVQAAAKTKISKCSITVKDATYTGEKVTPKVTVKYKKKALKEGKDYKLTFKNNTELGKGTCTIQGIGKYKGKVTKKFNIKLDTVKEIYVETYAYDGPHGDVYLDTSLFFGDIIGATGYIYYHSETEDGVYNEVGRQSAAYTNFYFQFLADTYVKIQALCQKDGKIYYGDMSEPLKLAFQSVKGTVSEYEVTSTKVKAPSNGELVYEERKDLFGYDQPIHLYLKVTNESDVDCDWWFVELYDANDNIISQYSTRADSAPGEDAYIDLSSMEYEVFTRGQTIKKILVIPVDVGPNGEKDAYSPDNIEGTDDTFGKGYLFDCDISGKLTESGEVELTLEDNRGLKIPNSLKKYNWIEMYCWNIFYVSEGGDSHYLKPSFVKDFNQFFAVINAYDEEFFKDQDNATITLYGGTGVEIEGTNKATICADYYTARFK